MDGWMDGRESGFKDCLQQSKTKTSSILNELPSSIELLLFVPDFCAIGLKMHGTFPRCRDGELTMEMGGG